MPLQHPLKRRLRAEAEPAAKLERKKMTTAEILAAARAKKAGAAGAAGRCSALPALPAPLQHPPKRRLRLRPSRLRSPIRRR